MFLMRADVNRQGAGRSAALFTKSFTQNKEKATKLLKGCKRAGDEEEISIQSE